MLAGYIPGVTDTIPLAIYFAVESGNMEMANILGHYYCLLGFSAILWLNWWSKRSMMEHSIKKKT